VTTRAKYRERLPQLDGGLFLTDGGLETTLIFHDGWDLPRFEAFVLLDSERGRNALRDYFNRYVPMAIAAGAGFILESPTWRANPDWGAKVGYGAEALARNNRAAIEFLLELRDRFETPASPMVASGAIGPRGDGYDPGTVMSAGEAAAYHSFQIGVFRDAGADLVSAFTMTNSNEAQGIALAAKGADMPCVIAFTVETDGRLPAGETLAEAIESVDAASGEAPAYYMTIAHTPRISIMCSMRAELGRDAFAGFASTHRAAATPNSTMPPNSTLAIHSSSAANMLSCFAASLISMCLAAAAVQITVMSNVSAWPAGVRRRQ
jgi:S-methylmethionine-dependent homocysteine/selenocysteine methylase